MTDTHTDADSTTLLDDAVFEAAAAARWSRVETARTLAWARALPLADHAEVMDRAANRWYRDFIDMYEDPSGCGEKSAYAFREQFWAAYVAALEELHQTLSRFSSPDPQERHLRDCVAAAIHQLQAPAANVPAAPAGNVPAAPAVPAVVAAAPGDAAAGPPAVAAAAVVAAAVVAPAVVAPAAATAAGTEALSLERVAALLVGQPDEKLLSDEVAAFFNVEDRSIREWRKTSAFPEPEKEGTRNVYSLIQVVAWARGEGRSIDEKRLPARVRKQLEVAREQLRERDANERFAKLGRQHFDGGPARS